MDTTDRQQLVALAARIISPEAHAKVATVLYEVLLEGTEFGPYDLPRADDLEWIRGAMAVPIQVAADAAIDFLVWSTTRILEGAPDGLLRRLEYSHQGEGLGRH